MHKRHEHIFHQREHTDSNKLMKDDQQHQLSWKCKVKPQRHITTHISARRHQIVTTPNDDQDVAKLDHSSIACCWWECKMVQRFYLTVWWFLIKLNMQLAHDPATALLGIRIRETKTCSHAHKNLYTNVHNSFICNRPKLETTRCS